MAAGGEREGAAPRGERDGGSVDRATDRAGAGAAEGAQTSALPPDMLVGTCRLPRTWRLRTVCDVFVLLALCAAFEREAP